MSVNKTHSEMLRETSHFAKTLQLTSVNVNQRIEK